MPITVGNLKKYLNDTFIETGTGRSDGVINAFNAGFKKCYTIELNEQFYKEAKVKMVRHLAAQNLHMYFGNSPEKLSLILEDIDEPVTFWLDAHSYTEAPLYEELEVIKNHHIKNHIILIDDVRCIKNDFTNVNMDGVIAAVMKVNPDYTITYEDGFVKNDVLVARVK